MTSVPMSEAKARLNALIRRVEAGEEIILTYRGQALARLDPVNAPAQEPKAR